MNIYTRDTVFLDHSASYWLQYFAHRANTDTGLTGEKARQIFSWLTRKVARGERLKREYQKAYGIIPKKSPLCYNEHDLCEKDYCRCRR